MVQLNQIGPLINIQSIVNLQANHIERERGSDLFQSCHKLVAQISFLIYYVHVNAHNEQNQVMERRI